MDYEATNKGTFWLPAEHRQVQVCCHYQVTFERDHFVYRLMFIQKEEAHLPAAA